MTAYNKIEIFTFKINDIKFAFTYFDDTYFSIEEYDDTIGSYARKNGYAYLENNTWVWESETISEDYPDIPPQILEYISKNGLPE